MQYKISERYLFITPHGTQVAVAEYPV